MLYTSSLARVVDRQVSYVIFKIDHVSSLPPSPSSQCRSRYFGQPLSWKGVGHHSFRGWFDCPDPSRASQQLSGSQESSNQSLLSNGLLSLRLGTPSSPFSPLQLRVSSSLSINAPLISNIDHVQRCASPSTPPYYVFSVSVGGSSSPSLPLGVLSPNLWMGLPFNV
ncbi:hypothetical protein SUGI_0116500 [Cryptomeria japonica]|nr:hypothetical protein SUGI_0116500 [Cryptomeria japonica]